MEIPWPICPTWPHFFIQDKLKISIYLSLAKYKSIKLIQFCISYFYYYELTSCIENSVDPDQLAGSTLFYEKPADQDPYCLQELISGFILFLKE